MSFNRLSFNRNRNAQTIQPQTVQSQAVAPLSQKFVHSLNVIMKVGEYKGMHGAVIDYSPGTYEIVNQVTDYIETADFNIPIGRSFISKTGVEVKVMSHIRALNNLQTKFYPIVVYRGDLGNLKIAIIVSSREEDTGIHVVDIDEVNDAISNLASAEITEKFIHELQEQLRNNKSFIDAIFQNKEELRKLQFILNNNNNSDSNVINKQNIIGKIHYINSNADVYQYNPLKNNYQVSYNDIKHVKSNELQYINLKNKSATYKGKTVQVIRHYPANLTIKLANGRVISEHLVNSKLTKIYTTHVFYIDLLLLNGHYAQVLEIFNNNTYSIIENNQGDYIKRMINTNEIANTNQGFKIKKQQREQQSELEEVEVDVGIKTDDFTLDDTDTQSDTDTDTQSDTDTDTQSEIGSEVGMDMEYMDEEREVTEGVATQGYRDIERSYVIARQLTTDENKIKKYIVSILNCLNYTEDLIELYTTIDTITIVLKQIREQNARLDIQNTNNFKYIILCIVMYQLNVKSNITDGIDATVQKLIECKFFKQIDATFNNNIFITPDTQTDINKANRTGDRMLAIKLILINADRVVQNILGLHINIIDSLNLKMNKFIPIGIASDPITGEFIQDPTTGRYLRKKDISEEEYGERLRKGIAHIRRENEIEQSLGNIDINITDTDTDMDLD